MTTPVLTVTAGEPASDALAVMRDAGVRHAVVVAGNREIEGVVSERDLGGVRGGAARRGRTVGDLMHEGAVVVPPDMTVTDAALLVRERRIGCLPVVEGRELVGIVTRSDLLAGLARRRKLEAIARSDGGEPPRPPRVESPNRDKWP